MGFIVILAAQKTHDLNLEQILQISPAQAEKYSRRLFL